MEAVNSGYDGVMFLDADNWYDDDHVEKCLAVVADNPTTAFIAARRRFVRTDLTVMASVIPSELPFEEHVDTNCMFLRWPIFPFLHHWCTMPQELAGSGDHLFYLLMMVNGLKPACVPTPTVNYLCLFDTVYRELGEEPPAEAKPIISWEDNQAWIDSLSPIDLARICNLVGMRLFQKHELPGAVA
jgi:hypothetical protein